LALSLAGCASPTHELDGGGLDVSALADSGAPPAPSYPPAGPVNTGILCARQGDDLVRDIFCGSEATPIGNLSDLQRVLGIDPDDIEVDRGASVTGHSTALATRSVSAVNPRVVFVRIEVATIDQEALALAFVRGEQNVELVVRDRLSRELSFYLVSYAQTCNAEPQGCNPGDLLTPETELGWQDVTLLDEEDLKNTVLDCRQCHQPDGPGTPKILRMQELKQPWTHWFDSRMKGGIALLDDYFAMKGDEALAGISALRMSGTRAAQLETFVRTESGNSGVQPNEFATMRIEEEVSTSAPGQPRDNSVPGRSAAWRAQYEIAMRGGSINVPYHDVKVTDPLKLAAATAAYQSYLAGDLSKNALPDFRDIYPDDPQIQAELGFTTEPGLDGAGVLRQACYQCHNPRLDQSLSRAQFTADLSMLDRQQRDRAIERLLLPPDDPKAMPPPRLRTLTTEARERLIELLR
jgi:hypothetical protein